MWRVLLALTSVELSLAGEPATIKFADRDTSVDGHSHSSSSVYGTGSAVWWSSVLLAEIVNSGKHAKRDDEGQLIRATRGVALVWRCCS